MVGSFELRRINRHDNLIKQEYFSSVEEFLQVAKEQAPKRDYYFGVNPASIRAARSLLRNLGFSLIKRVDRGTNMLWHRRTNVD